MEVVERVHDGVVVAFWVRLGVLVSLPRVYESNARRYTGS